MIDHIDGGKNETEQCVDRTDQFEIKVTWTVVGKGDHRLREHQRISKHVEQWQVVFVFGRFHLFDAWQIERVQGG